jgi:hypothetical protein
MRLPESSLLRFPGVAVTTLIGLLLRRELALRHSEFFEVRADRWLPALALYRLRYGLVPWQPHGELYLTHDRQPRRFTLRW